jgi:hypothetical protein
MSPCNFRKITMTGDEKQCRTLSMKHDFAACGKEPTGLYPKSDIE